LIDCNGEPRKQSSVLDPWQREDFETMDPGWMRAIGVPVPDGVKVLSRAYHERGRGHSKTTDLASRALWAIYSARRKINGVAGAAAKPQAKLLRDGIDSIVRLNPWLTDEIGVKAWVVSNKRTGSEFKILAANENTNYGLTPDFVIADELTHWPRVDLWTALFSAVAKRANCVLQVIANAGFGMGTTWHWKAREKARLDPRWHWHRLEGPQASWITPENLAEQREHLVPAAYKRLWLNKWLMTTGDALDMNKVIGACTLEKPLANPFEVAVGGLDLGLSNHHAAFVIFGIDVIRKKLRLLHTKRWDPRLYDDGRIKFNDVQIHVAEFARHFKVEGIAYDPWQAAQMAENLGLLGFQVYPLHPTAQNSQRMATELIDAFNHDLVDMYHDDSLITDLAKLNIVQRITGSKIEAPEDEESGHCDLAMAFAIGLPFARAALVEYAQGIK
jgi:hypothetical protein